MKFKNKKIIVLTLMIFLLLALSSFFTIKVESEGITLVGSPAVVDARKVCWNINGSMFAICNKQGYDEATVYLTGSYDSPYQAIEMVGNMLLDANWNPHDGVYSNYAAFAGGVSGDITIYNITTNPWQKETGLDVTGKCHSLEWHPNQHFLIGERLTDPTDSRLRIWNTSDHDPNNWNVVRTTGTIGSDMFDMYINGNKSLLSFEANDDGYTNYRVYVWDISDNDPNNWDNISGSPLTGGQACGSFSPGGNFIITYKKDNSGLRIYYTSNLSLYKSLNHGDTCCFSPDTNETSTSLLSGYVVASNGSQDLVVYNISDDYSITDLSTNFTQSSVPSFNPNGSLLGVADGGLEDYAEIYSWDFPTPGENGNGEGNGAEVNISFININGGINGTFIYDDTPRFIWTVVNNTSHYQLQISTTSDFSNNIVNLDKINIYNYPSLCSQNETQVAFVLPDANALTYHGLLYCQVKPFVKEVD